MVGLVMVCVHGDVLGAEEGADRGARTSALKPSDFGSASTAPVNAASSWSRSCHQAHTDGGGVCQRGSERPLH